MKFDQNQVCWAASDTLTIKPAAGYAPTAKLQQFLLLLLRLNTDLHQSL